jgi:large subunit ribosomal protein L9
MEVILLERIRNLGDLGEMVSVKAGYARNFLIPYKKAVVANEKNKAEFEARRAELEKAQAEALAAAQARADKLNGQTFTIKVKASEEGKLFGSIGPREIADVISAAGTEVSKAEIQMPAGPIKEIGSEEIGIGLHAEVSATVTIVVEAE